VLAAASLACAALLPAAAMAAPVTLDFNDLPIGDGVLNYAGDNYARDGFVLSTDGVFGFSVIGPGWADGYAGDIGLTAWGGTGAGGVGGPGTLSLRRSDGGVFDFNGLSLGSGSTWMPADVVFNAYDLSGDLMASITVPGASIGVGGFNAIDFGDRFLGVALVSWQQASISWQAHQLDDLRMDQTSAVPEPSTRALALAGMAMVALGSLRRRRQS
jgi:hypothetical protein